MSYEVTLAHIQAAAQRLTGIIHYTPVIECNSISQMTDTPLFFKCENLQRTGAFKIRGSYNRIITLDPILREKGIITASSGNSGSATAYAGRLLGLRTVVVQPENPAPSKRAAIAAYGAEQHFVGSTTLERMAFAEGIVSEEGLLFVHPFDDPEVIAGQGTIGLEIMQQLPDVERVIVQIGGGGLLSGIAIALRGLGFKGEIIGVEPEASPRMAYAISRGKAEALPTWVKSVGDGINSIKAGELTYPIIRDNVDSLVTVSDEGILRATKLLIERSRTFVEPSGAAPLAALLEGKVKPGVKTLCLISGGNSDIESLAGLFATLSPA